MKKHYLLFFFLIAILFSSCYDENNDFTKSLFTEQKMTAAFKDCLRISKDTAINHLCVPNGFYDISAHTIELPFSLKNLVDTLTVHGHEALLDSLKLKMNRTGESVGNYLTATFNSTISNLSFPNPSSILYGKNNAITTYMQLNLFSNLSQSLEGEVINKMSQNGGRDVWNQILLTYQQQTNTPINFDLYHYITEEILTSIFQIMEQEEKNIRTIPSHRVTPNLQDVFGNL
ncbi:MAG TPA: DUF4197 domain-containing protein [Bacteroidales bacterium]|jgi:hypothetical protein|nr:DUF4197 domain-containing protein [Bacteroidales bacterium]HQA86393.1 DUF4197 domain-containing protein [Bacteroidales bacterium]